MYHMNGCSITTRDPHRLRLWLNLFHTDRLPVKSSRPRWQSQPLRPGEDICAFDLDASRLHWMQRLWFADYISRRAGVSHREAMDLVDGWPIQAAGCEVIDEEETAVSHETAVFAFRNVRARTLTGIAA